MKDERIQTTANRFAAMGFLIWYSLLAISILCRTLILKQHPREWWDIFAIWVIGTFFVFIAYATRGVLDHGFKIRWLTIFIVVFVVNLTVFFIMGRIHSVVDVGAYLVGFFPGMALVVGIAYLLNRRWRRREGIEDER
jgi:hypothetical protein